MAGALSARTETASGLALPEPESFEDLRWPVGIRLQCLLHRGTKGEIVASSLIGYVVNEYLIIRTPLVGGLPMQLEPGEPLRVRAFSGMYVGEFKTEIDRVFRSPFYLHLVYPRRVRVQKLRSAPRIKVDLPASVRAAGTAPQPARLLDISINGAQVTVAQLNAVKDQMLSLQFDLDGGEGIAQAPLDVRARVVAVRDVPDAPADGSTDEERPGESGGYQSLGLVFDSLDASSNLRIANYVYLKLLAGAV